MKEYLPSRQFINRLLILAILCGVVFSVYKIFIFINKKYFHKEMNSSLVLSTGGNIQKDSNGNGIPDWEESLWGLDPGKNGNENKTIIENKKSALRRVNDFKNESLDKNISEDEATSREFFAALMSLEQSGNLDDNALQTVVETMGEKVIASPINDIYKEKDLVIKDATPENLNTYYKSLNAVLLKYQDKNIGDELTFISQGIANNDRNAMRITLNVANSYRSLGKELLKIPVPSDFAKNHLNMANNYEKTAESIEGMTKVLDEPLSGMKALVNYKKYNDALLKNIDYISDSLSV